MSNKVVKECLDNSIYSITRAIKNLEDMKEFFPYDREELQGRINVLCEVITKLVNESAKL